VPRRDRSYEPRRGVRIDSNRLGKAHELLDVAMRIQELPYPALGVWGGDARTRSGTLPIPGPERTVPD